MRFKTAGSIYALVLAGSIAGSGVAHGQAAPAGSDLETVVVTGRVRSLEQFTPTGSRLGLSARETPGTLDSINAEAMTVLGLLTVEKAAESLPGVNTGGSPGNPATFSMRGFTDGQITILHNGLYIGPSNMTNRPQNTFNLQTVEILKGPASVIYGQGAVGGAVNVTNKAPSFGPARYELQAGISSFGGTMFGIGVGGGLTEDLGLRLDVSRTSSEGYVHDADSSALNATLSLLWRVRENLSVQVSVDYAEDRPTTYFGTPLVPATFARNPVDVLTAPNGYVIDKAMREKNYNVADAKIYSHQIWPQVYVKWEPAEGVTFQNFTYLFDAKRRWINAESYTFNTTTRLIDRDRFFVFHEQRLWGDQASVTVNRPLGSLPNHFVVGIDYSDLDFERRRGFPDGDSVDPFGPGPTGGFGAIVPRFSPTKWTDAAVFFEDALDITDDLKLVVGGRLERLKLDRKNFGPTGAFQPGNSFSRTYKPATYRAGLVYDVNEYVTPYVSFTTGSDPVGSNIFIVNAGENFGLSKSRQVEVGVKASTPDKRFSGTLALYDIQRKNILTLTQQDVVSNVGEQTSRGLEVTADAQITPNWSVNGNYAYTDAEYKRFIDTNTGLDASGNRPTNVPKVVVNAWTSVRNVGGLPLELGAGYRYLGKRYGNTANTLELDGASLVNAFATYDLTESLSVTARVDNLFDKDYVQWADVFYPGQVILGRPRSYELSLRARF
jgi:iron complex outermembrane receptor protein